MTRKQEAARAARPAGVGCAFRERRGAMAERTAGEGPGAAAEPPAGGEASDLLAELARRSEVLEVWQEPLLPLAMEHYKTRWSLRLQRDLAPATVRAIMHHEQAWMMRQPGPPITDPNDPRLKPAQPADTRTWRDGVR